MVWWRRDPSLFTRSPIHRYAQRILHDHEAALRTRCFSRTSSKAVQHEDENGIKRPTHMSDLDWIRMKRLYLWRERIQDDPFKALFGASNDMLNGKGLIDWEWINKSFPKWMLNEVDVNEQPQAKRESTSTAREPIFPQPSFRKQPLDRDGIASPLDSRRPREGRSAKVLGEAPIDTPKEEPVVSRSTSFMESENTDRSSTSMSSDPNGNIAKKNSPGPVQQAETMEGPPTDNVARGSRDLRKLEVAAQASSPAPIVEQALENDWRQTVLQRRVSSASGKKQLDDRYDYLAPQVTSAFKELGLEPPGTPYNYRHSTNISEHDASPSVEPSSAENNTSTRSHADKLKHLPEHDIDFLSAADIRAAMGSKRGWLPTNEQKQASRQDLERAFNGSEEPPSIHPMLEAGTMNNQYIRRTERQMRDAQLAHENKLDVKEGASVVEPTSNSPAESSIDRMKRWLETTGASFAKTFWQDPTEEADVTKTKLFFDKVAHYVKKGRAANRQITDDLEKDIPASKSLLSRLKSDEERLDMAIHRLRQRASSGHAQDLSPRKIRAMESLKIRFHQTNHELETAYEALRGLVGTESVANATGSFKRRLTTASKVLHKNSQLLRMLIWSLQTRLEDPKIDRKILSNYKLVADNLLSLRDTQMTLMRLVDRAMLVYNVVPAGPTNKDTDSIQVADFENCEDPFVRARLAADVHLINEIKAHKSRSQEPLQEDSSPAPQPSNKKILDEPSPLTNSLFRPFGPVIDKLGNKELRELAAEKALEEEKRQLGDLKLVEDIKAAYEDTYGTITADHRQKVSEMPATQGSQDVAATLERIPAFHYPYPTEPSIKEADAVPTVGIALAVEQPVDHPSAVEPAQPQSQSEMDRSSAPAAPIRDSQDVQQTEEDMVTMPIPTIEHLPTHYTIIVRDSENDTLSITTSTTGPPRDTSPTVPLHLALSSLEKPAKFIPYITEGLEVVSANQDVLVLRDAVESANSTRPFNTIPPATSTTSGQDIDFSHGATNPIDGTTRLSPTGYVGPEESAEQLEKEFQERRHAANKFNRAHDIRQERVRIAANHKKAKRKGGAGSVVKTAIWVAGMCYVAGVIGEICT